MMAGTWNRSEAIARIGRRSVPWDMVIIGGGATGVGVALDAASRGLEVVLIEQADFGKGTSSRSTKLVHGGVRYLQQGNLTLVRDALRERTWLRNNAPHLVHDLPFLIPCRSMWQRFYFGVGLKLYDFLAVGNRFGRSHGVSKATALALLPTLAPQTLQGGVIYHDGQFDDARMLVNMARTAHDQGGCLVNYVAATSLRKDQAGQIEAVIATDQETGEQLELPTRCVVNATGPFCDQVRRLDDQHAEPMITPSQGVHIVLPRSFFPGSTAMIVPKTSDGRVIFLIPWHGQVVVGTTDTAISQATLEPQPQLGEVDFLLRTASEYLSQTPTQADILSVFTGIRPLVKGDKSARTASLSRDHVIRISPSGMLTITGGKWTTVRKMAEDCVDQAIDAAGLSGGPCVTENLPLHGYLAEPGANERSHYGSDLEFIMQLETEHPELATRLHRSLDIRRSEVVWAARYEMARTVEDVLARRTRLLFLDSQAAVEIASQVARWLAGELGRDDAWCDDQINSFEQVAAAYLPPSLNRMPE